MMMRSSILITLGAEARVGNAEESLSKAQTFETLHFPFLALGDSPSVVALHSGRDLDASLRLIKKLHPSATSKNNMEVKVQSR